MFLVDRFDSCFLLIMADCCFAFDIVVSGLVGTSHCLIVCLFAFHVLHSLFLCSFAQAKV